MVEIYHSFCERNYYMSLENNAICAICGKPYRVCHTCQNIKTYTPWRTVTDTLPHYTIYLAIYEYNKTKDKAKAKEELLKCDLSELDSFDKDVKKVINEILGENKKTVNTTPNKEQTSKTDNNAGTEEMIILNSKLNFLIV